MEKAKNELIGIVMNSLVIGLRNGHITKQEYDSYMQEVRDMQNDTPAEIQDLVGMIRQERRSTGD